MPISDWHITGLSLFNTTETPISSYPNAALQRLRLANFIVIGSRLPQSLKTSMQWLLLTGVALASCSILVSVCIIWFFVTMSTDMGSVYGVILLHIHNMNL